MYQGGDQEHGDDDDAVPLHGPGDEGVAAQCVELRPPGLGPAHSGGGDIAAAVREPVPVAASPLSVLPVRVLRHPAAAHLGEESG